MKGREKPSARYNSPANHTDATSAGFTQTDNNLPNQIRDDYLKDLVTGIHAESRPLTLVFEQAYAQEALRLRREGIGSRTATHVVERGLWKRIEGGENVKEGLKSFLEKRKPEWINSYL